MSEGQENITDNIDLNTEKQPKLRCDTLKIPNLPSNGVFYLRYQRFLGKRLDVQKEDVTKLCLERDELISITIKDQFPDEYAKMSEELKKFIQDLDQRITSLNTNISQVYQKLDNIEDVVDDYNYTKIFLDKKEILEKESHSWVLFVNELSGLLLLLADGIVQDQKDLMNLVINFLLPKLKSLRLIILKDVVKDEIYQKLNSIPKVQKFLQLVYTKNKIGFFQKDLGDIINALIQLFKDDVSATSLSGLSGLLLLFAFVKENIKGSFKNSCQETFQFGSYGRYILFKEYAWDSISFCEVHERITRKEMKEIIQSSKEKFSLLVVTYWIIKRKFIKNLKVYLLCKETHMKEVMETIKEEEKEGFPFSINFEFL